MSEDLNVLIRPAVETDCEDLITLIKELAEYEKLSHIVDSTAERLARDGFGPNPVFKCLVAELKSESIPHSTASQKLIGYALYFYNYSSFQGKCIYLEDLYVKPQYRSKGIGSRILKNLAEIARSEDCVRLDFTVLSWNKSSIDYYVKLGAVNLTETQDWHLFRFNVDSLNRIANGGF